MMNDPCSAFRANSNGSWTTIARVTIPGPNGQVTLDPGVTVTPGVAFNGLDIASWLNQNCRPRGGSGLIGGIR